MESTSSTIEKSPIMPLREVHPPSSYYPYPPPLATYKDVVASPQLFMDTLQILHTSLGTKFMIPVIGGKYLDLHRLFVEVTSRGGLSKVLEEKRWKEVTCIFSFPSSATNASFILRKYYASLLHHYERIYYFNATCWLPEPVLSPQTVNLPKESVSDVYGVIDGKFESGYLISVKIGSQGFKGVLYAPQNSPDHASSGVVRRKRRKKCEIKRRDPSRPKPNRSGYNFFFQEQHARLKPLFPGKDREISRMIGESWNKLKDPEKAIYQERAIKDKERYRLELEDYQERLRTGQVLSHSAVTLPAPEDDDDDDDASSGKSERSSLEDHIVYGDQEMEVGNGGEEEDNSSAPK